MRTVQFVVQNALTAGIVAVAAGCAGTAPGGAPASAPASVHGRWELLPAPGPASLRGLAVVDEHTLWVAGSGGGVWRSGDGGRTWTGVAPADCSACDFRDVEAFDGDRALLMVAGEPARVYRTADGGKTWQIAHADPRRGAFFDGLAFTGEHGLLFGDPIDGAFQVWTTADAGQSWQAVPVAALPAPQAGEAAFAASGTCVAVTRVAGGEQCWIATGGGTVPRVLRGERRGAAWRAAEVPLAGGAPSRGGFGFAFDPHDGRRAVLVGGDHAAPASDDGTVAWSDDAGVTWHAAAGAGGYRSAAVWLDDRSVLAVGPSGTSWSGDGARTWQLHARDGFHAVGRGKDGSVFACGSDGRVARWVVGR